VNNPVRLTGFGLHHGGRSRERRTGVFMAEAAEDRAAGWRQITTPQLLTRKPALSPFGAVSPRAFRRKGRFVNHPGNSIDHGIESRSVRRSYAGIPVLSGIPPGPIRSYRRKLRQACIL